VPLADNGIFISPYPTLTPTPSLPPTEPSLSIDTFANPSGQTGTTFTVTGKTDPYAVVDIAITPGGPTFTTTADAEGKWRYIVTKALSTGKKEITVTATNASGGKKVSTIAFTVKGSFPFGRIVLVVAVILLGGIGYIVYRQQMADQMPLPPPSTTPPPSNGDEHLP